MKKRLTKDEISKIILAFNEKKPELQIWLDNVSSLLKNSPSLNKLEPYTIKSRVKDEASLRKKIQEKHDIENRPITPETLFHEIEDLAGIRIVLDYKTLVFKAVECLEDLEKANKIRIKERTDYIWHPEEVKIVEASGGIVSTKESGYCSRHFILCPPKNFPPMH